MTDEEKREIIERILNEVKNKGSARIGFHAEKILKTKPPYSDISKIEGTIVSSKKYKSRPHPTIHNDFEILKNAEYRNELLYQAKIALIAGVVSLLVGLILNQVQHQEDHQKILQLQTQLDTVKNRLDRLTKK
jgi:hypothetical protein